MKARGRRDWVWPALVLALCGCESEIVSIHHLSVVTGPRFAMDLSRSRSLWDAPVPMLGLLREQAKDPFQLPPPPPVAGTALVQVAAKQVFAGGEFGSQTSAIYLRPGAPFAAPAHHVAQAP